MPIALLPASAQAFAPRSAPNIVLGSKVESWLTQTLKRVNRVKRPLNSVPQHFRCLTETLAGPSAIWTMCSMMLPKAPESELPTDANPLVDAMFNYQLIHVEAYVVHVDMVSQHDIAFKLTPESIETLIEYHKDIYSVDVSASTWDWPEKKAHVKKLQDDFVQAANRYVFRTGVRALEGMEEDGAGELLEGRSDDVKSALNHLFLPLLPPPQKVVEVAQPQPLPFIPVNSEIWWPSTHALTLPQSQTIPVDPWRVLPSTPSPELVAAIEPQLSFWPSLEIIDHQLPSPSPSYSQPCSSSGSYYGSPPCPTIVPALPFPSLISQQCGTSMANVGFGGFGGFNWGFNDFAPQYAAIM